MSLQSHHTDKPSHSVFENSIEYNIVNTIHSVGRKFSRSVLYGFSRIREQTVISPGLVTVSITFVFQLNNMLTWLFYIKCFQVIVGIVLLYIQLGNSALIGCGAILLLMPLQYFLGRAMATAQKKALVCCKFKLIMDTLRAE